MSLTQVRNRRLEPKQRFTNTFSIVGIISAVTGITLFIYFAYINFWGEDSELSVLEPVLFSNGNLTLEQLALVKQLSDEFSSNFTQDYMKSGTFLVNWLEAKRWNLELTRESLVEHLEWREEYRLDGIINEDFNKTAKDFQFFNDGVDKQGRPVFTLDMGGVDIRKLALAGKAKQVLRYIFREFEIWMKDKREWQLRGVNVTQGIIILNVDGLNTVQHLCYLCLPYLVKVIFCCENYPGLLFKIFVLNAPQEFDLIFDLAPEDLDKLLEVYGTNKAQWKKAILDIISPEQIRPQFGGTKVTDLDY